MDVDQRAIIVVEGLDLTVMDLELRVQEVETRQGNLGRIQGTVADAWRRAMNASDTVDQMEVDVEFLTRRMDTMVDAQMEIDQWVVWCPASFSPAFTTPRYRQHRSLASSLHPSTIPAHHSLLRTLRIPQSLTTSLDPSRIPSIISRVSRTSRISHGLLFTSHVVLSSSTSQPPLHMIPLFPQYIMLVLGSSRTEN